MWSKIVVICLKEWKRNTPLLIVDWTNGRCRFQVLELAEVVDIAVVVVVVGIVVGVVDIVLEVADIAFVVVDIVVVVDGATEDVEAEVSANAETDAEAEIPIEWNSFIFWLNWIEYWRR